MRGRGWENTGIFRPHTEGTETRRSLGHRGELALAGRTQRGGGAICNEGSESSESSEGSESSGGDGR